MHPVLRLYEDILSSAAALELPARPRMIFVVHGSLTIGGQSLGDGEAWHGEGAVTLRAGKTGAACWRWELAAEARATASGGVKASPRAKSSPPALETLPKGDLLISRRQRRVSPPAGAPISTTHQGPGIRCLIEGGIRIDTHGRSTCYGPGSAWYESGPEPVFAQAATDRPSRFIRVMILPA
jgi:hypothetical protein